MRSLIGRPYRGVARPRTSVAPLVVVQPLGDEPPGVGRIAHERVARVAVLREHEVVRVARAVVLPVADAHERGARARRQDGVGVGVLRPAVAVRQALPQPLERLAGGAQRVEVDAERVDQHFERHVLRLRHEQEAPRAIGLAAGHARVDDDPCALLEGERDAQVAADLHLLGARRR